MCIYISVIIIIVNRLMILTKLILILTLKFILIQDSSMQVYNTPPNVSVVTTMVAMQRRAIRSVVPTVPLIITNVEELGETRSMRFFHQVGCVYLTYENRLAIIG